MAAVSLRRNDAQDQNVQEGVVVQAENTCCSVRKTPTYAQYVRWEKPQSQALRFLQSVLSDALPGFSDRLAGRAQLVSWAHTRVQMGRRVAMCHGLQGKYSPEMKSSTCLSCPAGTFARDNASTCDMLNTTRKHGMHTHCTLNMTFQDLRDEHKERSKANLHTKYRTGGLGQTLFKVWLCVKKHDCSHPNGDWFCWVVDEWPSQTSALQINTLRGVTILISNYFGEPPPNPQEGRQKSFLAKESSFEHEGGDV